MKVLKQMTLCTYCVPDSFFPHLFFHSRKCFIPLLVFICLKNLFLGKDLMLVAYILVYAFIYPGNISQAATMYQTLCYVVGYKREKN